MIVLDERRVALLVLALASLSVLFGAHEYLIFSGASSGDDASSHVAEALCVARTIRAGSSNFWCSTANLGYPLFITYHALPPMLFGSLVAIFGDGSAVLLYRLLVIAGFMAMPFSFYLGARWLGLPRTHAVVFGLLSLAPSDRFAFGLGFAAVASKGLFAQLFGLLTAPLAIGAIHRALFDDAKKSFQASVFFALALLAHSFFGILAAIAGVVLVLIERPGIAARAKRLALIFLGALPLVAFWLLPFLLNLGGQGGLPWKGQSETGYPIGQLALWAVTGELLDHARLPWLSVLAGGALIYACFIAKDRVSRFALFFGLVCLFFWMRVLPIYRELEVIRYLSGLQLALLLLVAVFLGDLLKRKVLFAVPLFCFAVGQDVFSLFDVVELDQIEHAAHALASMENRGRVLANDKLHTLDHLHMNLLPALAGRDGFISRGRGYHDTPTLRYLESYDFQPEQTRLYQITHAVARGDPEDLPSSWRPVFRDGDLTIFETGETAGDFERSAQNEYRARLEGGRTILLAVSHHRWWHAYVDGEETPIAADDSNLMSIDAPPGTHELVFRFIDPWWTKALVFLIPPWVIFNRRRSRTS